MPVTEIGTYDMQKDEIIEKLKAKGCRITKQRLIILDTILEGDCSCCKEIYYRASAQSEGIGFATVYRMVNMLEEIGAIDRTSMYRVGEAPDISKCENCVVRLSDDTECKLTPEMWNKVLVSGLKANGLLTDQEIEHIKVETE